MPELSNTGSGARTTRSGRSNNQLQTRAGATAKVQIKGRALATENSQSIMSGGLAQASAVGNLGASISSFFGAVEQIDSDLTQVERAEELRVASEARNERDKLKEASHINIINNSSNSLFTGAKTSVIDTHNVMDGSSLASGLDEYYDVNNEDTGDDLLEQRKKNAYDNKVMPHLTLAAEGRAKEIRVQALQDVTSSIMSRTTPMTTASFANDFDMLSAIAPEKSDSVLSASLLSTYIEAAKKNGKMPQLSKFVSEAAVIKKGEEFQTFAERFPIKSAEMLARGWSEHQANQTQESNEAANDLRTAIGSLELNAYSDEDLAAATLQAQQFTNLYGDRSNFNSILAVLDEKAVQLGKQQAELTRWGLLHLGKPSNMKMEDYNQNQLSKFLLDPTTNFLDADLDDATFSTVSSTLAMAINNHEGMMGSVSKKVKSSISGMVASKDKHTQLRGFQILQKLNKLDPEMSARMLSGNPIAGAIYDGLANDNGAATLQLGIDVENEVLSDALTDKDTLERHRAELIADVDVESLDQVFSSMNSDSFFWDNGNMEKVADFLGQSDDDIFVVPGGPVEKAWMNQFLALRIASEHSGITLDSGDLADKTWDLIRPTLTAERVSENSYRVSIGNKVKPVNHLSSVQADGSLHNQLADGTSIVNPYQPNETVNTSANMDNSVQTISSWSIFGDGEVGYRAIDDGSGKSLVTHTNALNIPEDIQFGVGASYDLTGDWVLGEYLIPERKPVHLELTGDVALDQLSLQAIQGDLPESMQLIPQYPAGTSAAERKDGTVKAERYKISVYPHLTKEQIPATFHTPEVMEELSKGGHVNPQEERPPELQGFDKRPNKDHKWQEDQTITKDRLPFTNLQSQSDSDHNTIMKAAVMDELKNEGAVSPTVGLTSEAFSSMAGSAEDFSWFIQEAFTKVKEHMGTDSDPTYQAKRFEMIGEREAWRSGAYWDGVEKANGGKGYRTVGFGFNLDSVGHKDLFKETLKVGDDYYKSVYEGTADITEAQGRKLFDAAVGEAESIIDNRLKGVDLNHQQRLALVSMAYNSPKLIGKNLVGQLKSGDLEGAVQEILYKSNGSRMLGLYNRRYEEALTFVGANRANGIPSYLSYMADVLPAKYGIKLADQELSDVVKGTS